MQQKIGWQWQICWYTMCPDTYLYTYLPKFADLNFLLLHSRIQVDFFFGVLHICGFALNYTHLSKQTSSDCGGEEELQIYR